ncbi:MAG: hypothetical protein AVDCRST_MAG11-3886, partial [uncultured Gemmatimonadaceae bacterium]
CRGASGASPSAANGSCRTLDAGRPTLHNRPPSFSRHLAH